MLMPKRTKFRKMMKGRNRGEAHRGNSLAYGDFGIKAVEHGRVDSRQIEASRVAMTRKVKRQSKGARNAFLENSSYKLTEHYYTITKRKRKKPLVGLFDIMSN